MISKTMTTAAFAALLAASPMALAQTTAHTTPMTPTAGVTSDRIQPGQILGTELKGSNVYDSQNNKVGSVDDMILDRSGRVAAVVIGVKGKDVPVGMHNLKFAMNDNNTPKTITIDKSSSRLQSEPAFDLKTNTSPDANNR